MKKLLIAIVVSIILIVAVYAAQQGCCGTFCFDTESGVCPGVWNMDECDNAADCMLGCCTDPEGYVHSEYPKGECLRKGGSFLSGECPDVSSC